VTLTFHALWMLCALGAAAFAAAPGRVPAWKGLSTLAVSFALTAGWLGQGRLPDHAVIGMVAAVASGAVLTRPGRVVVPIAGGGVLAASWGALLAAQGVPMYLALAGALVVPMASLHFAFHRPGFVTPVMRDDALMGMLIGGLFVAMLPGVLDGWRAAGNLSVPGDGLAPAAMIPAWTLAMGAAALGSGAVYALWSRR
jgi:hypothetical protein